MKWNEKVHQKQRETGMCNFCERICVNTRSQVCVRQIYQIEVTVHNRKRNNCTALSDFLIHLYFILSYNENLKRCLRKRL